MNAQSGLEAIITVRDMATGREEELKTDDMVKSSLVFGSANVVFFAGASRRLAGLHSRSTPLPKAGRRHR